MFVTSGRCSMLESFQRLFGLPQIELGAEFPESIYCAPEMFTCPFRLTDRICPSKFVVRPRSAIAISKQIEDRNAAAEMLGGQLRFRSTHFYQAMRSLCFTCERKVGLRVGDQGSQFFQIRAAFACVSTIKMRLRQE